MKETFAAFCGDGLSFNRTGFIRFEQELAGCDRPIKIGLTKIFV